MVNFLNTTYDCSKYAKAVSNLYNRYFVAFDVLSVHILRFQENKNENYDTENGSILFEYEQIDYFPDVIQFFEENKNIMPYNDDCRVFIDYLMTKMSITEILKGIVELDEDRGFENYSCLSRHDTIDQMITHFVEKDGLDTISNITI